jgi:hypothetical protein
MNRKERRRRAKRGDIVEIKLGRVVFDIKPAEDTSRDICYVCGKSATAWSYPEKGGMAHGFADINGRIVLLCESCFDTEKTTDAIMRKYVNAPNLEISKGGTYESVEQLRHDLANAAKERGDKPTN